MSSSVASMSLLCLASMSRESMFTSDIMPLILLMFSEYKSSWLGFWTGALISARRSSMAWILLYSPLLSCGRRDMLCHVFLGYPGDSKGSIWVFIR